MNRDDLINEYFEWLSNSIGRHRFSNDASFDKLLQRLHSTEFRYLIPMDVNRADDGVELRWQFACDRYPEAYYKDVMAALDGQCSVLEMMIALCIRGESIMDDPAYGNRTGQWFWNMIKNLGLGSMADNRFDARYVDEAIERFLNREYAPDGRGGLFTIEDCDRDLRSMEIWHQLCYFLDSIT